MIFTGAKMNVALNRICSYLIETHYLFVNLQFLSILTYQKLFFLFRKKSEVWNLANKNYLSLKNANQITKYLEDSWWRRPLMRSNINFMQFTKKIFAGRVTFHGEDSQNLAYGKSIHNGSLEDHWFNFCWI